MARPFVAPPGVSADKAALLRRAFDATMQDGEFRAEAARMQADLAPTTGEYVQKLVARIYATPNQKTLGSIDGRVRTTDTATPALISRRPKPGQK